MEATFLGIRVELIISILAFVGAFATVAAMAVPFLVRDARAARLRTITKAREELSRQQVAELEQKRARWRPQRSATVLQSFVDKLNLEKLISPKGLKQKLVQAGYRQPFAPKVFVGLRVILIGAFLFGAFLYTTVMVQEEMAFPKQLLIMIGAGVVGFYLPQVLLSNAISKRRMEMQLNFPDALDLLVISSEAGLSIEAAFHRVTGEIEESSPALSEEFGLTTAELSFLGDRRRAYTNFADRTGLPSAKALAVTLLQSEKYGTSISNALKVLSQENRDERMSRAERKAASLPAQLTVPMIVFFLPVLFVVIMGPAGLKIASM
jgi:tight adherence protein C